jgi:hypothetical protein
MALMIYVYSIPTTFHTYCNTFLVEFICMNVSNYAKFCDLYIYIYIYIWIFLWIFQWMWINKHLHTYMLNIVDINI